jgi:hypothetical protein
LVIDAIQKRLSGVTSPAVNSPSGVIATPCGMVPFSSAC